MKAPDDTDAGWKADPEGSERFRYWDGSRWTERLATPTELPSTTPQKSPPADSASDEHPSVKDAHLAPEAVANEVSAMPSAPPGWYPLPNDPSSKRFWDGEKWRLNLTCGSCGAPLSGEYCSACGVLNTGGPLLTAAGQLAKQPIVQPRPAGTSAEKSVGLALFLNFMWPGAGHLYAGVKTDFGIIFMVIFGGLGLFAFVSFGLGLVIYIPAWMVCAPWTMIDVNNELKGAT